MGAGNHFKFTITKKMMGGFISVLILMIAMVVIAFLQLNNVNSTYQNMINDRVTKLNQINNLQTELSKMTSANRGYLLTGEQLYLNEYEQALKNFEDTFDKLSKTIVTEQGKAYLRDIKSNHDEYVEISKKMRGFKINGDEKSYLKLLTTDVRTVGTKFHKNANALAKHQQDQLNEGITNATKDTNTAKTNLVILCIVAIIIGFAVAIFISRLIAKPVIRVSNAMNEVAKGNLAIKPVHAKNRDEIGTLVSTFNKTVETLRQIISQVSESSNQVAASSEQLSASSEQSTSAAEQVAKIAQETAVGTSQQLSQFQEVTASIQEMANGMDQIASNSEHMLESTENATELTQKGFTSVEIVVKQMDNIYHSVDDTTKIIQTLGQRSNEISGIVSLITNIADQTNLLALNAAIEAARAGEHGKGFAVVADEVRKLAEESKSSADKITEMITLIQRETEQAVTSMEAGNKQVEEGLTHTNDAKKSFLEITSAINGVTEKVQEVSASVEEMNALSGQIADAIEKVKEISQQGYDNGQESSAASEEQLATMEEVSSSAQALSGLAEELQQVVARFKV